MADIIIRNVRLAFPDIWQPKAVGDSDPRYSATLIFAPDHPAVKQIEDAIKQVAKDMWGAKAEANLVMAKAKNRICLRDGAEKAKFDGFLGNKYVTASAKADSRPTVWDKDGSTPLRPEDGRPYAGCIVNAEISIWAQDNQYGVGINCGLKGLQFARDDKRFGGGGASTAGTFSPVEEEGDLA